MHPGRAPQALVRHRRRPEGKGRNPMGRVPRELQRSEKTFRKADFLKGKSSYSRLPRRAGPLPGRGRLAVRVPVPLRRRGAPRMRGRVRPPGRALVLGAEPPERNPQAVEDLPGHEAVQG